jgi:Spy/CpxP family protein refolding chaperone
MRLSRIRTISLGVVLLALAPVVVAQDGEDTLHRHLFAPEFIADHQHLIGLTDDQFRQLKDHVAAVTGESLEVKRGMAERMERLEALLSEERVDVDAAVAAAERLLAAEQEMKLLHLRTMISIKNILNGEQQDKLRQIREQQEQKERFRDQERKRIEAGTR